MSDEALSPHPKAVRGSNSEAWWYEEPGGIEIYTGTGKLGTIRWGDVRRALARKDSGEP